MKIAKFTAPTFLNSLLRLKKHLKRESFGFKMRNIALVSKHEENFRRLRDLQARRINFRKSSNFAKNPNVQQIAPARQSRKIYPAQYEHPVVKNNYEESFQKAIAPVLVLAQFFGQLPVQGITAKNAKALKFSWINLRTFYSLFLILCTTFHAISAVCWVLLTQKIRFDNVETGLFYTATVIITVNFFLLARKWPEILKHWENTEKYFTVESMHNEKSGSKVASGNKLSLKIRTVFMIGLILSGIEHFLSILTTIKTVTNCFEPEQQLEQYFRKRLQELVYLSGFSKAVIVFGTILSVIQTFVWNFMDFFVMIIAIGLTERFKKLNYNLFAVKGQPTSHTFWIYHRQYYRSVCNLCEDVDSAISVITFLSFSINLYFICTKLLHSLNPLPTLEHTIYFWFSLIFLLGRTLAVSLFSADINDESNRPLEVFRRVPEKSWCLEVKRFYEEVSSDTVALSGMKFFYITRSVVLSVAGTIVTYELVLIQFHADKAIKLCS